MKLSALLSALIVGILISGCASQNRKSTVSKPVGSQTIVTPDASLAAKVVSYNSAGRFVVLSFPAGQMPRMGQSLFLYHNGLKVGAVKTDTWQRDNFVVADVVNGDAQVGDEARDQ